MGELEETRVVLATYRRFLAFGVTTGLGCGVVLLFGSYSHLPAGVLALAVFGLAVSLIFTWWWAWFNHSVSVTTLSTPRRRSAPGPAHWLRKAQRAYNDHLTGSL